MKPTQANPASKATEVEQKRQPHAVLDLTSRYKKALKIERLLKLSAFPSSIKLLEIGTGSGGIAYYFAHHPTLRCEVTAVDVVDQRLVTNGYAFVSVQDTRLPFENDSFDVVLSNHVIEHVGDARSQAQHLQEIHRVLRVSGVGYLAVPNRWMLIEPHFRLAFLSWLPSSWRTAYLRLMKRGDHYDCNPLTTIRAQTLLTTAGFDYIYLSTEAIRETLEIEANHGIISSIITYVPTTFFDGLDWLNPTLIYKIEKSRAP